MVPLAGHSKKTVAFMCKATFLWHNFNLISVSQGRLPVYFGVGRPEPLRFPPPEILLTVAHARRSDSLALKPRFS